MSENILNRLLIEKNKTVEYIQKNTNISIKIINEMLSNNDYNYNLNEIRKLIKAFNLSQKEAYSFFHQ